MSAENLAAGPGGEHAAGRPKVAGPRFIFPVVLLGLFWAFHFTAPWVEMPSLTRFVSRMAVTAVAVLAWIVWWWVRRRSAWSDKTLGFVLIAIGAVLAGWLCHHTVSGFGVVVWGLPRLFTAVTLWMLVARHSPPALQRAGLAMVVALTCAYFTLLRFDGLSGEQESKIAWRWNPTAEDQFLASRTGKPAAGPATEQPLTAGPDDWPGFRGPNRDGVIRGRRINTDWDQHPPRRIWQNLVGPAWSSMIVVGDRLFTQEQRGPQEAVVCYNAATGDEMWVHADEVRFEESVSGAGPRATPTFANGRLYTLGAKGLLNCLDATTGDSRWRRDILTDTGAALPLWGLASSPLVADAVVVVYAGGAGDKRLLGYRADSGRPAWTATAGDTSYSSPELAILSGEPDEKPDAATSARPAPVAGQAQVLFLSNQGLEALDPPSGQVLWEYLSPVTDPRALQPHVLGGAAVLLACDASPGLVRLDVTHPQGHWSAAVRWANTALRTSFNDLVVDGDYAYGFNAATLCCVDLRSGKRQWKEGRYGHGQVVLLADQRLLLVLSETGQAVLVRAQSQSHEEIAHFQALLGKCWNHPLIVRGRLYVRNAEEMACYDVTADAKGSQ